MDTMEKHLHVGNRKEARKRNICCQNLQRGADGGDGQAARTIESRPVQRHIVHCGAWRLWVKGVCRSNVGLVVSRLVPTLLLMPLVAVPRHTHPQGFSGHGV